MNIYKAPNLIKAYSHWFWTGQKQRSVSWEYLVSGISVCELIFTSKKRRRSEGGESLDEHSPQILSSEEKATTKTKTTWKVKICLQCPYSRNVHPPGARQHMAKLKWNVIFQVNLVYSPNTLELKIHQDSLRPKRENSWTKNLWTAKSWRGHKHQYF